MKKMTFLLYLAIVESAMKLAVALSLSFFHATLLILYGALLLAGHGNYIVIAKHSLLFCNRTSETASSTQQEPMLKKSFSHLLPVRTWLAVPLYPKSYTQNIILNIFPRSCPKCNNWHNKPNTLHNLLFRILLSDRVEPANYQGILWNNRYDRF